MNKIVSQLDSSGRYVGAVEADESPLEPGVFHIPGGAVDVPPPVVPGGKFARWANGWVFEDLALVDQPVSEEPSLLRLTALEFLDLFQEAEQLAIVEASMQSAPIKLWYDRTLAASFVTIADARVSAGLTALVAAGLLSESRKAEIIAAMTT